MNSKLSERLRGGGPPGPSGLPLLGSTLDYVRDPFEFLTRPTRQYGTPVVRLKTIDRTVYRLNHPDAIEHVLVHNNENYVKGDFFQDLLGPVLGEGLLTSEGEFWRRQRHLIQPSFHPRKIAEYAGVMTEYTERTVDEWRPGETRNVHEDMMSLTLEIVADALFGADVHDRTDVVGAALNAVMARSDNVWAEFLPNWVPIPANRRFETAMGVLDSVVYDIIRQRRRDPGDDVVSALLAATDESGEGMDVEQIHDEVMTLLLAGHETTALSLSFTFFLLGQHPDVERRLVAELDDVLGGEPPTMADLDELTYLERVVKESMRLYPPVYAVVREAVEDDEIGGHRIPEGATVSMSQWEMHHDPRFYDDPMAFRPSRWTDEFEKSLPRLAYFPFAAGPRRCIGDRFAMLEARLVLATVLRRYHLELVSSPSLDLAASITARPKTPIEAVVRERDRVDLGDDALGAVEPPTR